MEKDDAILNEFNKLIFLNSSLEEKKAYMLISINQYVSENGITDTINGVLTYLFLFDLIALQSIEKIYVKNGIEFNKNKWSNGVDCTVTCAKCSKKYTMVIKSKSAFKAKDSGFCPGCKHEYDNDVLSITKTCIKCRKKVEVAQITRKNLKGSQDNWYTCFDCKDKSQKERDEKSLKLQQLKEMPYDEYLDTEHWQELRKNKLAGASCATCGRKINLSLHHKNYDHLGEETSKDVIVLCDICHRGIHTNPNVPIAILGKISKDKDTNIWFVQYSCDKCRKDHRFPVQETTFSWDTWKLGLQQNIQVVLEGCTSDIQIRGKVH